LLASGTNEPDDDDDADNVDDDEDDEKEDDDDDDGDVEDDDIVSGDADEDATLAAVIVSFESCDGFRVEKSVQPSNVDDTCSSYNDTIGGISRRPAILPR
jgi:hypothetical protein